MAFLGIDTATRQGSVAIVRPGLTDHAALAEGGGHARDLLAVIEALLGDAGVDRGSLEGIGVAVGPGSFTGIRVGMATAKGLGLALDIPVAGISTLEAIARAAATLAPAGVRHLCPILGAGRGEVYAAIFALRGGAVVRLSPDQTRRPAALAIELPADTALAGEGGLGILAAGAPGCPTLAVPLLGPAIAAWAAASLKPGAGYHAGGLGPNYVRPSDAEASRRRA
jgi:tRNA threonylcarbamoyladenosine biosynthesis protein TsaB